MDVPQHSEFIDAGIAAGRANIPGDEAFVKGRTDTNT